MSLLSLTQFQPDQHLFLATDVSSFEVGAVLFHRFPDGSDRVVAHVSKSVTPAEHNYSQIEREALSIVFGTKKFY